MATRIGCLKLPAGDPEGPVIARLRAESLLATLSLEPAGLPDRSVLVVRSMRIPQGPLADSCAAEQLRSMRSRAIRPEPGALPRDMLANAQAVIFDDEVELLACLTLDALAGVAGRHWYWRYVPVDVASTRAAGDIIADAWLSWPRWVPGAVASFGVTAAITAVSTLSSGQSRRIRAAVTAEHLPGIGAAVTPSVNVYRQGRRPTAVGSGPVEMGSAAAPWRAWLTLPATLEPESAALLGLLTGLRQADRVVRDPTFHRALQDWMDRQSCASIPAAQHYSIIVGAVDRTSCAPEGDMVAAAPVAALAGDHAANNTIRNGVAATMPRGEAKAPGGGEVPVLTAGQLCNETDGSDGLQPENDATVCSHYASLLLLVNLLDRLQPADQVPPPDAPSGWTLLELVGRELLVGNTPSSTDVDETDPVWAVLAELDGREPGTLAAGVLGDLAERALRLFDDAAISVAALARPGLILLTRTHLDVVFDIETVDMAVRISGLDCDPGWVPELGRIIAFHFEAGVTLCQPVTTW